MQIILEGRAAQRYIEAKNLVEEWKEEERMNIENNHKIQRNAKQELMMIGAFFLGVLVMVVVQAIA